MTTTEQTQQTNERLEAIGFSIESSEPKQGEYPQLGYSVKVFFKGKLILETDYHIGIGNLDIKSARVSRFRLTLRNEEFSMLEAWKKNPQANFKDKELQMRVALKVAQDQKFKPDTASVLYSLMSDGEAFFNAMSFEQWANELGCDTDSRKALAIYTACDQIGRKLSVVGTETLSKARKALENY